MPANDPSTRLKSRRGNATSHVIITGKVAITSVTITGVMILIVVIAGIMPVTIVLIITADMLADIVMVITADMPANIVTVIMEDMQTGAIMAITGSIVTTLTMVHIITGTTPACISVVCM